jgi:hypothetical protein
MPTPPTAPAPNTPPRSAARFVICLPLFPEGKTEVAADPEVLEGLRLLLRESIVDGLLAASGGEGETFFDLEHVQVTYEECPQ